MTAQRLDPGFDELYPRSCITWAESLFRACPPFMASKIFYAHGIEMDVAIDCQRTRVRIVEDRLKASLKQSPDAFMQPVKPGAIGKIEPLHCLAQVCTRRFDLKVIMVSH